MQLLRSTDPCVLYVGDDGSYSNSIDDDEEDVQVAVVTGNSTK